MTITDDQIKAAGMVANMVHSATDGMTLSDGVGKLFVENSLNKNSARDFITGYSKMMRGEVFKRALSAPAVDHFLKKSSKTTVTKVTQLRYLRSINTLNITKIKNEKLTKT